MTAAIKDLNIVDVQLMVFDWQGGHLVAKPAVRSVAAVLLIGVGQCVFVFFDQGRQFIAVVKVDAFHQCQRLACHGAVFACQKLFAECHGFFVCFNRVMADFQDSRPLLSGRLLNISLVLKANWQHTG